MHSAPHDSHTISSNKQRLCAHGAHAIDSKVRPKEFSPICVLRYAYICIPFDEHAFYYYY